ncbi:MAG TPA: hypothetical protein VFR37_17150 [Longimicrobium sp.]|nr:hypothetical protein [Longimicrobium sp.]
MVATVRTARGDTLGTTPLQTRLRPRERRELVLTAPGYDSAVVTIGWRTRDNLVTLINPAAWIIDGITGAAFVHDPETVAVALTPSPVPDEPVEELPDAVMALVLDELADAAEDAGCEPLLVEAWRDAAHVLANADPSAEPVPDSIRRMAGEEADRVAPEIREICARPSAKVDALRRLRETLEDTVVAVAESPPLLSPVYFGPDEWEIRDDSVRMRLRALGARLRDEPVSLIVEGFADGAELHHVELGAQRAWSVIRELQAGGLGANCCRSASHSDDPDARVGAGEAWLNRRVTFTLDYERSP